MAIFNSYVKLPEDIKILRHPDVSPVSIKAWKDPSATRDSNPLGLQSAAQTWRCWRCEI